MVDCFQCMEVNFNSNFVCIIRHKNIKIPYYDNSVDT